MVSCQFIYSIYTEILSFQAPGKLELQADIYSFMFSL